MPTSGYLKDRIKLYDLSTVDTQFGQDSALILKGSIWANVRYQNGTQILRQGDLMMASTIVITCRRHTILHERSHIEHNGKYYRITSFNEDKGKNSVTITAEKYEK